MKTLSLIITVLIFLLAGCEPLTPEQQAANMAYWQAYNSNYQRELDRQAYGRQPVIIQHQRNPNYWQEAAARQQVTAPK